MSLSLSADTVIVIALELALLGLVAFALCRDGKLPISRSRHWVRRIHRPRATPVPRSTAAAEGPLEDQAVADSASHATVTIKRGELTMGLIIGGYATVVGASYAILDSALGLQGWQAALMTLNTLLLGL